MIARNAEHLHVPKLDGIDLGVTRTQGPGLGNLLFPISRAVIGQYLYGGRLVIPTLRQLKLGPYLRGEKDKRNYGKEFRHRSWSELADWARVKGMQKESRLTVYSGMKNQFHNLTGHNAIVKDFLERRAAMPMPSISYDIAMHIRQGDFAKESASANRQNVKIPLEWYSEALAQAKSDLDVRNPRILLFTDGDFGELEVKLSLTNAIREPKGTALGSMLLMSNAKCLIGSRSTFSLWGQYLGDLRSYWPEGFGLGAYKEIDLFQDRFV